MHSSNGAAHGPNEGVNTGNGESLANRDPEAADSDGLLQAPVVRVNGEASRFAHEGETERNPSRERCRPFRARAMQGIKDGLTQTVCWRVKLWMVIILLLVIIIAVIVGSMAICTATHEDEDEKFDRLLFELPQYFNGSFQMPNVAFTEELFSLSSNYSQTLATDLQDKLSDLYRSSTALGRYFSTAEISAFRQGSVIAEYELTFLLPKEGLEDLRHFVVSREMVFNVFRQFLSDQETPESDPLYIDPDSLIMF
ncbi:TPA-induced transmembrane protein [Salarias fasciatus]|uniref:SEA domain-containing protein n=1 Tax=Salarias fasciatus TaxID=181472 RepID=A0A672IX02_SALFA|nr:TPA-induced transmembrane protein [Salarias fasciatus]